MFGATDGARAVSGINPTSAGPDATLEVSSPDSFDIERVYEARIWRVIDANRDDATIAHEFRWVNGVGAVELTLTEDTAEAVSESSESKPVSGWFHKVIYLQHQSAEGSGRGFCLGGYLRSDWRKQRKHHHQADDGSRVHPTRG